MRTMRFCLLLLVFILGGAAVTLAQQSVTIQVSPQSGAPGTTVTITEVGSSVQVFCTVQLPSGPVRIGALPGAISYTIPGDIRANNTLSFQCSRPSPRILSNTVAFRVTEPPPADSDGDGIPDNQDQCPNQGGDRANNGCPAPANQPANPNPPANPPENPPANPPANSPANPATPSDRDGDGIVDSADSCPNQAGNAANGGCPAPSLPALPTSGQCVVATQSATRVNIREDTSTSTAVVGQLDPAQTYPVLGQSTDSSGREWLQVAQGWVASWVTRQGGDCGSLPDQVRTYNFSGAWPVGDGGDTTASSDLTNGSNPEQILVALLLPAIQSAREAGRRSSCTDRCPVPNPDDFAAALPFLKIAQESLSFNYSRVTYVPSSNPEEQVDTTLIYGTSDSGSHPGAVHVLFCDGSVRFVSGSVQRGPLFGIADPQGVEMVTLPNVGFVVWGDSTEHQIPFVLVRGSMPTLEQLQPTLQILTASGVNTDHVVLVDMRTVDASLNVLTKDTSAAAGKWIMSDYNFENSSSDTNPLLWLVNQDGSVRSSRVENILIAVEQLQQ